jgi:hypothetical protein
LWIDDHPTVVLPSATASFDGAANTSGLEAIGAPNWASGACRIRDQLVTPVCGSYAGESGIHTSAFVSPPTASVEAVSADFSARTVVVTHGVTASKPSADFVSAAAIVGSATTLSLVGTQVCAHAAAGRNGSKAFRDQAIPPQTAMAISEHAVSQPQWRRRALVL